MYSIPLAVSPSIFFQKKQTGWGKDGKAVTDSRAGL